MEVKHKKLGISIIGEKMTPELSFKNLMLAVELYKNNIITLGKFAELIGLPVHDSARILESIGIKPELGAATKEELDKEIQAANSIL